MEYLYVNALNLLAVILKAIMFHCTQDLEFRYTARSVIVLFVFANSLLFPIFYRYVIKGNPRILLFSIYSLISCITTLFSVGMNI